MVREGEAWKVTADGGGGLAEAGALVSESTGGLGITISTLSPSPGREWRRSCPPAASVAARTAAMPTLCPWRF